MNKDEKILKIKEVIENWGVTSSFELELESSPCINSIGNGKNNVCQLAEYFQTDGVGTITYHDEIELGTDYIPYEDLSDDLIDEIYNIILVYEQKQEEI